MGGRRRQSSNSGGILVGVVYARRKLGGKDFNIGFLIIVLIEEVAFSQSRDQQSSLNLCDKTCHDMCLQHC